MNRLKPQELDSKYVLINDAAKIIVHADTYQQLYTELINHDRFSRYYDEYSNSDDISDLTDEQIERIYRTPYLYQWADIELGYNEKEPATEWDYLELLQVDNNNKMCRWVEDWSKLRKDITDAILEVELKYYIYGCRAVELYVYPDILEINTVYNSTTSRRSVPLYNPTSMDDVPFWDYVSREEMEEIAQKNNIDINGLDRFDTIEKLIWYAYEDVLKIEWDVSADVENAIRLIKNFLLNEYKL